MYIDYFHIRFRRLRYEDIELLRQWRNAEWMRPYMHDQRYITKEMQKKWFRSIDNLNNWYFIIETDDGVLGSAALKHINFETGEAEPGVMMGGVEDSAHIVSSAAMMFVSEVAFNLFGLSRLEAYLYESHKRALASNKKIGANILKRFGSNSVYTELTPENFEKNAVKLRKALRQLTDRQETLTIQLSGNDPQTFAAFILKKLHQKNNPQAEKFRLIDNRG